MDGRPSTRAHQHSAGGRGSRPTYARMTEVARHASTARSIPPSATMVAVLNGLLAHEIGAADIYDACWADVPSSMIVAIAACQDSHVHRSALIRQAITDRGGEATVRADLWGSVTAVLMTGARVLGTTAVLSLLVKGEEETLVVYQAAVDEMDMPSGNWLREHCIPEQIRTLRAVHEMDHVARS